MFKKLAIAAIGAALTVSIFGAPSATASTDFGDDCAANTGVPLPYTAAVLNSPPTAIPLSAPVSGVITKVKVRISASAPFVIPELVRVLRPAGGNSYTTVAEAEIGVTQGETISPVRLPVQAGDRLGVRGLPFQYMGETNPGALLLCVGETENIVSATESEMAPGQTGEFSEILKARIPLLGTIEPDADGDGFGDETQDACPQSPTVQIACPVVTLSSSATVGKKFVTVLLTGPTAANVTVNGKVPLGKGKKAKLKGGTKGVVPGAFTKFRLKFPAKLIKRLKELPPSKKLTLKVTATAPNVAVAPTKKVIKVKLRGQAPRT